MSYFYKYNEQAENLVNQYFMALEEKNRDLLGGQISVLLLGSLSRGEGTWIQRNDRIELLSDIEFFTIYPSGFSQFSLWDQVLEETKVVIFNESGSVLFHVDNTYVCIDAMKALERKLLTFDAQNMGVTVVGDDHKDLIPQIDITNINYFDLKDILTHRVFSVLYYGEKAKTSHDDASYRYSLAKNSLDLMTVLLVENGILLSGFGNRCDAVERLQVPDKTKKYFKYCLCIKLGSSTDVIYTISEMEELFINLADSLYKEFKVPLRNCIINSKSIVRRLLGILKRTVKYRHVVVGNHYKRLSETFHKNGMLTDREIRDNLVLNGYPLGENRDAG